MALVAAILLFGTTLIDSVDYYVDSHGVDDNQCGLLPSSSCGTLHYISTKIDLTQFAINIYVNGQNESQINQYIINNETNYSHPCIFGPLNLDGFYINEFNIIFGVDIKNMNDWYPDICKTIHLKKDSYLFQFEYINDSVVLNFENLIITDHTFDGSYGILWTNCWQNTCNNCLFVNINVFSTEYLIKSSAIQITSSVFSNITANGMSAFIWLFATYYYSPLTLKNIVIENIFMYNTDFISWEKARNFHLDASNIYMDNISVKRFIFTLIDTDFTWTNMDIADSQLLNIKHGEILHINNSVPLGEAHLKFVNILISTQQTHAQSIDLNSLFYFYMVYSGVMMYDITFDHVQMHYDYYLHRNCNSSAPVIYQNNTIISVECNNPIQFVSSRTHGWVSNAYFWLFDVDIFMIYLDEDGEEITLDVYRERIGNMYNYTIFDVYNQDIIVSFYYEQELSESNSLILSEMDSGVKIIDLTIYGYPISTIFIYLKGVRQVDIDKIVFVQDNQLQTLIKNPNDLTSTIFLKTHDCYYINVTNSEIAFSTIGMNLTYTLYDLYVDNNSLHDMLISLYIPGVPFEINSCIFSKLGDYYSNIFILNVYPYW
eukprot:91514_1